MAVNPMQRKTRNAFIIGMLITMVVAAIPIALMVLKIKGYKDAEKAADAAMVSIYVLNDDIKSGDEISASNCSVLRVNRNLIPENAIANQTDIDSLLNSEKPSMAKVDLKKNTVITEDYIADSDKRPITDDVRRQEYNMIVLPIDLETKDVIDIRFMLPNGQDFIVVSKVKIEIPVKGDGTYMPDTIFAELKEDEILALSSAIVEAYGINGAKLYATKYVESGMQKAASISYVPNEETIALIRRDPNIVEKARNELSEKYRDVTGLRNDYINRSVEDTLEYNENVQGKITEQITKSNTARQTYLNSLGK